MRVFATSQAMRWIMGRREAVRAWRPTGGRRYRSEIRHGIRTHAERNLVLIVAVTWRTRSSRRCLALRASNSPDGIPDTLGSDIG